MTEHHRSPRSLAWIGLTLATAWILSCATAPPPKAVMDTNPSYNPFEQGEDDSDGMTVTGLMGTLDSDAIQIGMEPLLDKVTACYQRAIVREPYVGGQILLFFRIARDGSIKKVFISQSDLGSYPVESCILQALSQASFDRPMGGEAEFSYPLTFPAQMATQPLAAAQAALETKMEQLLGSGDQRLTPPRGLALTYYLNRSGKVVSAGLACPEAIQEEFASRLMQNLLGLELTGPGESYNKATYRW